MKKKYDSFDNGRFCVDIEHARRFDVASALLVTQYKQGKDRVFCRVFLSGTGVSRKLVDLLPINDHDAMTIMLTCFEPKEKIPDGYKVCGIDDLIEKAKSLDNDFWVEDD